MSPDVDLDGGTVRVGDRRAPRAAVRRLHETYGRWTGRAALRLVGTGLRVPVGPGYGSHRATLLRSFRDVPFASDWMDGRFPGAPGGLPPDLAFALGVGVAAVAAGALGVIVDARIGLAAALIAAWPLGRLRDGWVVRAEGLRGGPPWAPLVPWYDLTSIHVHVGRRRAWIFTRGPRGGHAAPLPLVLLPAFRARVRRLGGLDLIPTVPGLEDRYLRWREPAIGIPWGIGAGTAIIAGFTPTPWTALLAGASATVATGLLGAMVTLRAGGWGAGGVLAATLLYGLLLLLAGLLAGGWIGAT